MISSTDCALEVCTNTNTKAIIKAIKMNRFFIINNLLQYKVYYEKVMAVLLQLADKIHKTKIEFEAKSIERKGSAF
jgi:hypothetical protein